VIFWVRCMTRFCHESNELELAISVGKQCGVVMTRRMSSGTRAPAFCSVGFPDRAKAGSSHSGTK